MPVLGEASSSLEDHNFGSDIADACPIRSHWYGSAPAATLRDTTVTLSLDNAALCTCNKDIFNSSLKAYAVIRLWSHWSVILFS